MYMFYLLGYKLFGLETYMFHEYFQNLTQDEKDNTMR